MKTTLHNIISSDNEMYTYIYIYIGFYTVYLVSINRKFCSVYYL